MHPGIYPDGWFEPAAPRIRICPSCDNDGDPCDTCACTGHIEVTSQDIADDAGDAAMDRRAA